MEIERLIQHWQLEPLAQEGGYYRRLFTHPASYESAAHAGRKKAAGSAIYFLVTADTFSALHRLASEELFFFLEGDACTMLQLDEDTGQSHEVHLGVEMKPEVDRFVAVPAGVWQGLRLDPGGRYALFGVTVMPGFEWVDFELGDRGELTQRFPQEAGKIAAFTR